MLEDKLWMWLRNVGWVICLVSSMSWRHCARHEFVETCGSCLTETRYLGNAAGPAWKALPNLEGCGCAERLVHFLCYACEAHVEMVLDDFWICSILGFWGCTTLGIRPAWQPRTGSCVALGASEELWHWGPSRWVSVSSILAKHKAHILKVGRFESADAGWYAFCASVGSEVNVPLTRPKPLEPLNGSAVAEMLLEQSGPYSLAWRKDPKLAIQFIGWCLHEVFDFHTKWRSSWRNWWFVASWSLDANHWGPEEVRWKSVDGSNTSKRIWSAPSTKRNLSVLQSVPERSGRRIQKSMSEVSRKGLIRPVRRLRTRRCVPCPVVTRSRRSWRVTSGRGFGQKSCGFAAVDGGLRDYDGRRMTRHRWILSNLDSTVSFWFVHQGNFLDGNVLVDRCWLAGFWWSWLDKAKGWRGARICQVEGWAAGPFCGFRLRLTSLSCKFPRRFNWFCAWGDAWEAAANRCCRRSCRTLLHRRRLHQRQWFLSLQDARQNPSKYVPLSAWRTELWRMICHFGQVEHIIFSASKVQRAGTTVHKSPCAQWSNDKGQLLPNMGQDPQHPRLGTYKAQTTAKERLWFRLAVNV